MDTIDDHRCRRPTDLARIGVMGAAVHAGVASARRGSPVPRAPADDRRLARRDAGNLAMLMEALVLGGLLLVACADALVHVLT